MFFQVRVTLRFSVWRKIPRTTRPPGQHGSQRSPWPASLWMKDVESRNSSALRVRAENPHPNHPQPPPPPPTPPPHTPNHPPPPPPPPHPCDSRIPPYAFCCLRSAWWVWAPPTCTLLGPPSQARPGGSYFLQHPSPFDSLRYTLFLGIHSFRLLLWDTPLPDSIPPRSGGKDQVIDQPPSVPSSMDATFGPTPDFPF